MQRCEVKKKSVGLLFNLVMTVLEGLFQHIAIFFKVHSWYLAFLTGLNVQILQHLV